MSIKTYKGFRPDLTCQPDKKKPAFQYKEGESYEADEKPVRCKKGGFHSCVNPLDVIAYYPPALSVYHTCEADGEIDESDEDTKIASSKITIKASLSILGLCSAAIEYMRKAYKSDGGSASGNSSIGSASGNSSIGSASGDRSIGSASGDRSIGSASGYRSIGSASGYRSIGSASGDRSIGSASGDSSIGVTNCAGSLAEIRKDNNQSNNAIAVATGPNSCARAPIGCWIVCSEWNKNCDEIIALKSAQIDGKKLKPDTWYTVRKGRFVKVKIHNGQVVV